MCIKGFGTLKCNSCNTEMEKGESAIKATRWGFFFHGTSFKHLFFKTVTKPLRGKEVVLKNNQLSTAYKCHSCGAVTIMPDATNDRSLFHW